MMMSEKTARELDRYTRNLVKRLPGWARKYFQDGLVTFAITNEATIELEFSELVPKGKMNTVCDLVGKLMEKLPSPAIMSKEVH